MDVRGKDGFIAGIDTEGWPPAPLMSGTGRRAVVAALLANLGVATTKFFGFLITGSSALLAETLHSIADTGNQALLLLGAHRAGETPSPAHPFGRGRERYFWAFVVGLVLFGLGGVFSLYEGVRKLQVGEHEVTSPIFGVCLLLAAFVIEGFSLRTAVAEAQTIRPAGQSWWSFIRRTRNPEVTVVLLEDGAAIIGLTMAMAGLIAAWATGDPVWDAVATIGIGVLLCLVAGLLTTEMKSLLIGETVSDTMNEALWAVIAGVDGVDRVLNLRTEHIGPEQVLVCVKVAIAGPADLDRVIDVIDAVEAAVEGLMPSTLTCYVEPDRYDATRRDVEWT